MLDGTPTPATESTTKSLEKISTSLDTEKQSKAQNELPTAAEKEQNSIQDFETAQIYLCCDRCQVTKSSPIMAEAIRI